MDYVIKSMYTSIRVSVTSFFSINFLFVRCQFMYGRAKKKNESFRSLSKSCITIRNFIVIKAHFPISVECIITIISMHREQPHTSRQFEQRSHDVCDLILLFVFKTIRSLKVFSVIAVVVVVHFIELIRLQLVHLRQTKRSEKKLVSAMMASRHKINVNKNTNQRQRSKVGKMRSARRRFCKIAFQLECLIMTKTKIKKKL